MERRDQIIIVMVGAFLLIIGIAVAYHLGWITPPPQGDGGSLPRIDYRTNCEIINWWGLSPSLGVIASERVSPTAEYPGYEVTWFEDEVIVVFVVTYPNGNEIKYEKKTVVSEGYPGRKFIDFDWYTRQEGLHEVVVTLLDKNRSLLDEKTEAVNVVR